MPDVDKYNTSCVGSGFAWESRQHTKAPGLMAGDDGSGYDLPRPPATSRDLPRPPATSRDLARPRRYVRDILPLYSVEHGEDIPRLRREETEEAIQELVDFLWLDERTRAMSISFSIYNANYNTCVPCNFLSTG